MQDGPTDIPTLDISFRVEKNIKQTGSSIQILKNNVINALNNFDFISNESSFSTNPEMKIVALANLFVKKDSYIRNNSKEEITEELAKENIEMFKNFLKHLETVKETYKSLDDIKNPDQILKNLIYSYIRLNTDERKILNKLLSREKNDLVKFNNNSYSFKDVLENNQFGETIAQRIKLKDITLKDINLGFIYFNYDVISGRAGAKLKTLVDENVWTKPKELETYMLFRNRFFSTDKVEDSDNFVVNKKTKKILLKNEIPEHKSENYEKIKLRLRWHTNDADRGMFIPVVVLQYTLDKERQPDFRVSMTKKNRLEIIEFRVRDINEKNEHISNGTASAGHLGFDLVNDRWYRPQKKDLKFFR